MCVSISWENETRDNSEYAAVDVHKHNTAVLLSYLIESCLGCLETKGEVTCRSSFPHCLAPAVKCQLECAYSKSVEPIKMPNSAWLILPRAKQNSAFLLESTARKERPEHR